MESEGTQGFTPAELRAWLREFPVKDVKVDTVVTHYDRLHERHPISRGAAKMMARLLGRGQIGWFMLLEFAKT